MRLETREGFMITLPGNYDNWKQTEPQERCSHLGPCNENCHYENDDPITECCSSFDYSEPDRNGFVRCECGEMTRLVECE